MAMSEHQQNDQAASGRNGRGQLSWVRRHARGVVVGTIMGLGVMAIAGGGLGGYVAYVKQKAPPVVQDTAIPAAETIANAAETAARVVVGGPGSGDGAPVAAAGLSVISPGDGSMPTAPESGTPSVSIEIVSKDCKYSSSGLHSWEVFHDGSYWIGDYPVD